jgi:hypothetical protein
MPLKLGQFSNDERNAATFRSDRATNFGAPNK